MLYPMPGLSNDAAAIANAQADPQQFSVLYEKYVDAIYRYIYYRVGNNAERAQDFTAEVFCRALQQLPHYHDQGYPYSAYLYQVARTVCIDYYRKPEVADINEVELADRQDLTIKAKTEVMLLWQYIERECSTEVKTMLELRFIDDLPYDDIATLVGKQSGTVRTAISRALDTMREFYENKAV